MAILMRSELEGVTAEQIEPFIAQLQEQMRLYPGFICQASGPIAGGYQMTEVWETQEAHERWLREVVEPHVARRLGLRQALPTLYLPLDRFITR
jgi:hypothetical protein